ncbi:hypothetical protein A6F55_24230 [Prescottella equi]|uniref:hypothetical protein n=1 Tax=Rhodococcus hoagii TaxID=43767 RepID=UPI000A103C48|nr:hypothetical protein [Prescottella equi]ORJ92529.1 hypothetical protein A6F55_24230 [Prescottella equi]
MSQSLKKRKKAIKKFNALPKDPEHLDALLKKLHSRTKRGIATKSDMAQLTMLVAYLERMKQEKAGFQSKGKDYKKLHETLEHDRARDAKRRRSDRSIPVDRVISVVSGGAPGLGRRS